MPRFIPCPGCEQHVKLVETSCPHCGAKLRDATGKVLRTASAAMLGLVAAASSCSEPVDEYGPAPTVSSANSTGSSMGGDGGTGGMGADGGTGGVGGEPVAEYGPSPTVGPGGGAPGGAGGSGGTGGN